MLQEEIAELQSRLDIASKPVNRILVKKYQELKDKIHDTAIKFASVSIIYIC